MPSTKKPMSRGKRIARGIVKYAPTAIGIATKAIQIASQVAAIVNAENKFFDTTATSTAVNTTPAINCITAVPQGDTVSTRDGNSIKANSLQARFNFRWNGTTIDTKSSQRCRLMIVRDLAPNSHSAPIINDILQYTSNAQQLMQSPLQMTNSKRFQLLKDQVYTQNNEVGGITVDWYYKMAKQTKQVEKMSAKTDPHITWSGTGGTDYAFGHVYIILIGDIVSGSATATCEYMARLRYYDN